jgi:hypothetical protein
VLGEREMSLSFHGRQFKWTFLLADVKLPIIGVNFLRHFCIVVDLVASQFAIHHEYGEILPQWVTVA